MFEELFTKYDVPLPSSTIGHKDFARWGKNNRYSAIRLGDDGIYFEDFVSGVKESWFPQSISAISFKGQEERKRAIVEAKRKAKALRIVHQEEIAITASSLWGQLFETGTSPYLEAKQVESYGVRYSKQSVIVPLRDIEGKLWSFQIIHHNGNKRFLAGGKKKGCFHTIGRLQSAEITYCVEGYATGASIYMATGKSVVVCFDAGNLEPVIASLKAKYPHITIIIAADNDQWGSTNTGKVKAEEASVKYGCHIVMPKFLESIWEKKPTDFNDLHVLVGLDEVKRQLMSDNYSTVPETDTLVIKRLAAMPALEYDRIREFEAKRLNVRVGILDKEVVAARKVHQPESNKPVMFPAVNIWPEPVNAEELLNEIVQTIRQFIVCDLATANAAALWIVFTWFIDNVQVAPLAVITAPEMRCGKSQLLNLIERLVYRPLVASNISPAAMFRVIEAHKPTLLIDEADTFLKENEELRGVVNSGHTRQSAYVIRTTGEEYEPKQFSTWGAKAISGIGTLPETIRDRAIILELRRKLPTESVKRLRHAEKELFERLTSQLARLAQDAGSIVERSIPNLPDALNDRAQDNWEPLLAIADYAGAKWSVLARETALKISGSHQEPISLSTELLADIREIFDTKGSDRLKTADLLQALTEDDSKPWATYNRGKPITASQLAKRLKEYRISSGNKRFGYEGVRKGFVREQFDDAFNRYLNTVPIPPDLAATALQSISNQENPIPITVAANNQCSATENHAATLQVEKYLGCSGVAAETACVDVDEERAAIMEYDGGLSKQAAEQQARTN